MINTLQQLDTIFTNMHLLTLHYALHAAAIHTQPSYPYLVFIFYSQLAASSRQKHVAEGGLHPVHCLNLRSLHRPIEVRLR